jgi:hypothetical protein
MHSSFAGSCTIGKNVVPNRWQRHADEFAAIGENVVRPRLSPIPSGAPRAQERPTMFGTFFYSIGEFLAARSRPILLKNSGTVKR